MKILCAQTSSCVGDFSKNIKRILEITIENSNQDLIIFPEAFAFGYDPCDLLERASLVDLQLEHIQNLLKDLPNSHPALILGAITKNSNSRGRLFHNSALLIQNRAITKTFNKELLPNYDIFNEKRHIEPGKVKENIFKFKGKNILLTICEDIWGWEIPNMRNFHNRNPLEELPRSNIDLVINLSASPYDKHKIELRDHVIKKTADYFNCPIVYLNLVSGQNEVIFDGSSKVYFKKELYRASSFKEDIFKFELDTLSVTSKFSSDKIINKNDELYRALVFGLKEFFEKNNFKKAHLGLSGGIDSALVCALACDALGAENITALGMPTSFNSPQSLTSAEEMSRLIGCRFINFDIQSCFETLKKEIDLNFNISEFGLIHENLQARLRGLILMSFSNSRPSLLLATSNKSELTVGYSTLYGDQCGALMPIGDLLKSEVYELCKHRNLISKVIPEFIIQRPPSAELRPNQKDSDSLPNYDTLDSKVNNLITKRKAAKDDIDKWILNKMYLNEFKRWQAPPILKISPHAFGSGRLFPLAHKARD